MAALQGGGQFDTWKLIGNAGGEDFSDKVRGPLNEGGLWLERIGTSESDGYCDPAHQCTNKVLTCLALTTRVGQLNRPLRVLLELVSKLTAQSSL
jgi:hypothetical protein